MTERAEDGGDAPRVSEPDYDDTWTALETASKALKEVRAVDLSSDQHEDLVDAAYTIENIQQSLDDEIAMIRGEDDG